MEPVLEGERNNNQGQKQDNHLVTCNAGNKWGTYWRISQEDDSVLGVV